MRYFMTAWIRQSDEAVNIEVNSALLPNVLGAFEEGGSHPPRRAKERGEALPVIVRRLRAVVNDETPFHEDEHRLPSHDFYDAHVDNLLAAADRMGFTWSARSAHDLTAVAA
jgi:hypothetical protein